MVRPSPAARAGTASFLAVTAAMALGALAVRAPVEAAGLAPEHALLEWTQVALLGLAAAASVVRAAGLPVGARAPFVLGALVLGLMIARETDLELVVFQRRVLHARLLRGAEGAALSALVLLAVAGALAMAGAYAWRHRRAASAVAAAAARTPGGALLGTALVLTLVVQALENELARLPLPAYFVEESLELVADLLIAGGLLALPGRYDSGMANRGAR